MRLLRWSACFCHLASVLLLGSFCMLSGPDDFVQDIHPWLDLQGRPIFLLDCRRTFQTSESLLDLDHTNEVRGLQLSDVSCISCRILQNLRITSFRPSRRNWHASFSWEISTRTEFWIKLLNIFSLTLANPFIDFECCLVRLFNGKRVECKLNYFSINYLYDVLIVLEMSFASFRGLGPLRCHRIISKT